MHRSRRDFLATSAALAGGYWIHPTSLAAAPTKSPNQRPRMGAIGLRYQGSVITEKALPYADLVAVCDVDQHVREQARAAFGSKAAVIEDYRQLLDRKDIDVVMIGTPDHWHTKMVIDACRAGKDIYVEKPLTLTIDEGKQLTQAVADSQRIVQVGTWQRSDVRFRHACEVVRSGRIGKLKRVIVTIDANPAGGPFQTVPVPKHLNWDLWLGQAPTTPYIEERCHYTFRWWYEYSGGKMTDWGAHHIDIAQWGMGTDQTGPISIVGEADMPTVANGYNTPTSFLAKLRYAHDVELEIRSQGTIGVRFEGEKGSVFVTRGSIESNPKEILTDAPLERSGYQLYSHDLSFEPKVGKLESIENHMHNFFQCVENRQTPISDVVSQHRSVSVCHLANIAMRLGRPLQWNPGKEQFVDDSEADTWLAREQRKGFETV